MTYKRTSQYVIESNYLKIVIGGSEMILPIRGGALRTSVLSALDPGGVSVNKPLGYWKTPSRLLAHNLHNHTP